MNQVSYSKIKDFLDGRCSDEERRSIIEWITRSEENERTFFRWEELYFLGKFKKPDLAKAEEKLLMRIKEECKARKRVLRMRYVFRYAAMIVTLLAITAFAFWYFVTPHTEWMLAQTTFGETKNIVLEDGTKVWLNENTVLKYPKKFLGNKRMLELDGEAYFEVAKNKQMPFVVEGKTMQIEVLGTKFNFKNRTGCRVAEASLLEGEIRARGNDDEGMILLAPGQRVELNSATKQMKIFATDAGMDAMWHDNLIPLDNANIFHIASILEELYDVEFILSPDIDKTVTYSGVLGRKKNIIEVLDILKETIHIDYKIHNNTIFISTR
ncbi:FecR family protein [Phocaeicola sp.]|uniref:FecR family protein n=1 Tax=Phocaeicola sp. TaxID=2773926 RepID=UPI003A92D505